MTTQEQKASAFVAMHSGEPFVIPNPWDAGSARVLAALGFKALASTSSGMAFTLGRLDGHVTLEEVVERVAAAGAVGGSIEDCDRDGHLYGLTHATERIAAAVHAARSLGFPFTLTARAENHIRGNPDIDDTIARLRAFEEVGADVLYAPGLRSVEEIRSVCDAVSKPVNVLALRNGLSFREIVGAGAQRSASAEA